MSAASSGLGAPMNDRSVTDTIGGQEPPHIAEPQSPTPNPREPRPSTPPMGQRTVPHVLRTPEPPSRLSESKLQPPRTPSSSGESPHPASVYLSSPIRRSKHASWLTAGTMTPGRPSLKHNPSGVSGIPSSPFKATRPAGGGTVNLGTPQSMATLPIQTLMMTQDQAREIKDLDTARDTLVLAIEQGEQFRKSAQQFRSLANHYAFQHKLVQIERDESEQRFEVEANIQKREIEKLVVDIMGYNDKSMDTDQIRRRLKRTKQRLKEMEDLVAAKDHQTTELQSIIAQYARLQSMPMASASLVQAAMHSGMAPTMIPAPQEYSHPHHAQPPHHASLQGSHNNPNLSASQLPPASPERSSEQSSTSDTHEKPKPPPIDTHMSTKSSPGSPNAEPLSALEVLASQVLSSGIQHPDGTSSNDGSSNGSSERLHGYTIPPVAGPAPSGYGSSPYSSPFYAPFSPYSVPPQYARQPPSSVPQFGSPEKRRRPSSSSTISAISEEDTLEDINNE